MGHDAPQLDYAAARPAKRRWRRWVAGVLLVALVGAGVAYRGPIVRRGRVLYWQRLCLTYSRSAGTPLATTRPSAAADPDYLAYPMPNGSTAYALSPACWRKLEAERWPRQIMQMLKVSGIGPAVVFLHERVSPAGHRRVVRVEPLLASALSPELGYHVTLVAPGSVWREPRTVGVPLGFAFSGRIVPAELFFGRADPDDASHFSFDYAVSGNLRGTVDGWLRDDDTVVFKLRDPASTRGI